MPNSTNEHDWKIPDGYHALDRSEQRPAPGAKLIGPADPTESFSATILLRRRPDGPPVPGAKELLASRKRQPSMSEDEFAAKYGAAPEDVEKVTQFVKAHGLTILQSHLARRTVVASGTVAQMSSAFLVQLGTYEYPIPPARGDAAYRGRNGVIAVPKALAQIILGVFGLDNRKVGHSARTGDPPSTSTLAVKKATELYNFPDPGQAMADQTIGIISPGGNWGYLQSDLDSYFDSVGERKVTPVAISVAGAVNGAHQAVTTASSVAGQSTLTFGPHAIPAGFPAQSYAAPQFDVVNGWTKVKSVTRSHASTVVTLTSPLSFAVPNGTTIYFNVGNETTQDVCVAASAAPGANIAVYFAPATAQGWLEVFLRAIWPDRNDKPPSVLSCSFGLVLGDDLSNDSTSLEIGVLMLFPIFALDAFVRGVTICACTGDNGSQGLVNPGDGHAHVWYPASDPYVLGVGGTTLGKTRSGEWVEYVWNDASGATGGGVSDLFEVPEYQSFPGTGVPHTVNPSPPFMAKGRGVPDVAANASLYSGYPMFFCGGPYTAAGTSAATPLWAGLIALINSYKPNPWGNIGFVNWQLYQFAVSFKLFNVLNELWPKPGNPNLADCPTSNGWNGVKGYSARVGWDACTGWGSPNGRALLGMFQFID